MYDRISIFNLYFKKYLDKDDLEHIRLLFINYS
jgi:hypothetical protein